MVDITASDINDNFTNTPRLYTISAGDSYSTFHDIGKVKWLRSIRKSKYGQNALALLGEESNVSQLLFNVLKELVSIVCGNKGNENESD